MTMRRVTSFLLVGSALVAGSASLYVSSSGASFSGVSPSPSSVAIYTPDGGPLRVGVDDSVRLDTNITNDTVPVAGPGGARLTVEALGPAGGPLWVTGISGGAVVTSINANSLNALLHPTCTQGLPELLQAGPTPIQVPRGPGHAHPPTSWVAVNLSNSRRMCCMPSFDGGVPTIDCDPPADGGIGLGFVVPAGGRLEITGDGFIDTNYCRADGTMPAQTVNINAWEESCVQ